jgi:GNAT superfamily N-acetyltransferase
MKIHIGQKFNYLTVLELPCNGKVSCKCDCGTVKSIRTTSVTSGRTKSCGCYNRKAASQRMHRYNDKYTAPIKHPVYNSWKSMKTRRIASKEWSSDYQAFYDWSIQNGWSKGLVLRRRDNTAPCSPANCYWGQRPKINQNIAKRRATCLKKYGVESYTQSDEHKARVKATSINKYGTSHPSQSEEVKQKIRDTNLQRYGFEYAAKSPKVQNRIRETCLKKYGVSCTLQDQAIKNKAIQTCMERYGAESYHMSSFVEQDSLGVFLGDSFQPNRTILNGKEIDFYDDDLRLGIEYCGLHWHHELSLEPRLRNYHYDKYKQCLEQDIRLITIFSDEWLLRQPQVQGYLDAVLHKNKSVYGRKCYVDIIDSSIGKNFIQQFHIQGCRRAALVYFGLYYQDELCGVLSLNNHHRMTEDIVLDRLAFVRGVSVLGGASKLLKYAIQWCKQNSIHKITTWSDNRWSSGTVYHKMGFVLDKEIGADYSYVKISQPRQRISKQSMMKSKTGCPSNITEKEWCLQHGYARIWDCGKKRFVYNV